MHEMAPLFHPQELEGIGLVGTAEKDLGILRIPAKFFEEAAKGHGLFMLLHYVLRVFVSNVMNT
jgi:hypothetical protein